MKRCKICNSTQAMDIREEFQLPIPPISYWAKDEDGSDLCGRCYDFIVETYLEYETLEDPEEDL